MNVKRSPLKLEPRLLPKLQIPSVPEDGVLPHDQWNQDLELQVPNSADIKAGGTITLTINGVPYGTPHTVTLPEATDPGFKFLFTLPSNTFPSGDPRTDVSMNYEVRDPETGLIATSPYRYILIFDKEAPGAIPPTYIGFTQQQLQGIYTADVAGGYLAANVSPWPKMAAGDTIEPWLSVTPPDDNVTGGLLPAAAITIEASQVGGSISLRFPKMALEALGDVVQHFGYQLKDKLGNTSSISLTRAIQVNLRSGAIRPRVRSLAPVLPRVARTARLADPVLEPAKINGLRPRDGRITLADLGTAVMLIVPMPAVPIKDNVAQVSLDGELIGSPVVVPAVGSEFTLRIEPGDLSAFDAYPYQTVLVDYSYSDPVAGDPAFSGSPLPLVIDRYAPGGNPAVPPAIAFTEEQLAGITEDDMDTGEDGLIVHISSWFDDDYDDQVQLWLGKGPAEADGTYLATLPPVVSDPSAGLNVTFPRTDLEAVGANPVYFGYRITDWAGNVSLLSSITPINVYLAGVPGPLERPLIIDAAPYNPEDNSNIPPGTGLLVWTEANPEATVHIPIYPSVAAGDRVYIIWNTKAVSPVTVTQTDIDNGYLLNVKVQYLDVAAGPPGINIPISYRVSPLNGSPSVTSPIQYINVNLTTPGGPDPDPDPETPEHENMRPLQVLSAFNGSVPNVIPPEAFASPANITVFRAGQDNKVIWLVGDKLNIFWGADHSDDPAEVPITAGNEPANIIIPVDATFIADNGTGSIPVYYTLTRDLGNGNEVTVRSFATTVLVQSPGEAPGGPAPLQQANFPESITPVVGNPYRLIQRAVGLRGTTLRIPLQDSAGTPLANVAAGDFISVSFYGVDDPEDGEGHDADPAKPPIENSRITIADYVILAADITQGYYTVPLPYTKTYYICRNLSVTNYSIRNAAGITKNAPQTLILFALNQSGGTCTIPVALR
jgi:hypothetical protein